MTILKGWFTILGQWELLCKTETCFFFVDRLWGVEAKWVMVELIHSYSSPLIYLSALQNLSSEKMEVAARHPTKTFNEQSEAW